MDMENIIKKCKTKSQKTQLISFRLKESNIEFLKELKKTEEISLSSIVNTLIEELRSEYKKIMEGSNEKGL